MTWVWYVSVHCVQLYAFPTHSYRVSPVSYLARCAVKPGQGKTIQVISFLSAIMRKNGVITDKDRRRKHVSKLQDGEAWKKRRELPPADATWPTCLIIAPSTVVHNWERELETVGPPAVFHFNLANSI